MNPKRGFREQLRIYLSEQGLRFGKSTFDKLCSPAVGKGPPVAAWLGSRPIYDFDEGLAWGEAQLRPSRRGGTARTGATVHTDATVGEAGAKAT